MKSIGSTPRGRWGEVRLTEVLTQPVRLVLALALSVFPLMAPGTAWSTGQCTAYDGGTQVGTISDESLSEASGLAASFINPGIYWTHNDSGNPPLVFAIQTTGEIVATFEVKGAFNVDWEDIAIGPCPDGCSCLFVADMGDNLLVRPIKTIYRVPEPLLGEAESETEMATEMTFSYPDGRHDAETLLVDPHTGDIYVVTKVEDGHSKVYRFPEPDPAEYPVVLEEVASIELVGDSSSSLLATGGSVAADGGRLVVRALDHAQEYLVPAGQPLAAAFGASPSWIPLPASSQGEGISYKPDGMGWITVSENLPAPVYAVSCVEGTAVTDPAPQLSTVCESSSGCSSARTTGPLPAGGVVVGLGLGLMWMRRKRTP